MRRLLSKYGFANMGLKLLALAISFFLWATYTAEPYAEVGFQVPLEFASMPSRLEMSGDMPTTARVRVRGRSALLRRMVPADLTLLLDMTNAKQGAAVLQITPEMVGTPFDATVVEVSPAEIHVTLVPRNGPPPPIG